MGPETIIILMLVSFLALIAVGVPMAWAMLALTYLFGYQLMGPSIFQLTLHRTWELLGGEASMMAIPLFVLMANMLRLSGVADDLYDAFYRLLGWLPGGLAVATVISCAALAALEGTGAAGITLMGMVALPAMLSRDYNRQLALGTVMAGGGLSLMIPPSVLFIFYGVFAGEYLGSLTAVFIAGIGPGLLLALLYALYAVVRAYLDPTFAPPDPDATNMPFRERLVALKKLAAPAVLIGAMLGSIYLGVATVGQASGIGAFASMVAALARGRLTWDNLKSALYSSMATVGMIMWVIIAANAFVSVILRAGGATMIGNLVDNLSLGPWGTLIMFMVILFVLGMFIEDDGIIILTVPIFAPIAVAFGFDPVWFAIIYNMNLQMAMLSPPYAPSMFYLQGVAPRHITTLDLYRSVWPFLALQAVAIVLVMIFPGIALWLPNQMLR